MIMKIFLHWMCVGLACGAQSLQASVSLWLKAKPFERSMFADRIAAYVGQQLEVIITDQGNFVQELTTEIKDNFAVNDAVTQWLFPLAASKFGSHNGALPGTQMNGADTISGSWKIDNKQTFTGYRFSVSIVDDLGDGRLVISGKRWMSAGEESYFLRITGTIRREDITPQNTIESTKIAEARFEILSEGVLSQGQQGGWLEQAYEKIQPF
jgi:flagellar L-ring protein precursor FlgH